MNHLNGNYEILGHSPEIGHVIESADRAAKSDASVLIMGETGTGKYLVARQIHYGSARSGKRFVTLNCGGIPYDIAESELFGHERGSFTGAEYKKPGLFEIANDGTLFLDEIGNMGEGIQAKLLTACDTGTFMRVGGTADVTVDIRLVAAANQELLGKPKFREDLYYRLSAIRISIPPLRERPRDIESIANFYMAALNKKYGLSKTLTTDAVDALMEYRFPGNVRELVNILEHSYAASGDETAIPADVVVHRISDEEQARKKYAPGIKEPCVPGNMAGAVRAAREAAILRALKKSGGNIKRAAEILETPRSNLYKTIRQLGYQNPEDLVAAHQN